MGRHKRKEARRIAREKEVERLVESHHHAKRMSNEEKRTLKQAIRQVEDLEKAQEILQEAAKRVQDRVHTQLSGIVTKCLKAIFDDPYTFEIEFKKSRGKTKARPVYIRNGMRLGPHDQVGGSVLEVTAFALRLGCLMIQKPHRRRLVVLDEPFLAVSDHKDKRERIKAFLETLSKELNVQFIIATNDTDMEIGTVIVV